MSLPDSWRVMYNLSLKSTFEKVGVSFRNGDGRAGRMSLGILVSYWCKVQKEGNDVCGTYQGPMSFSADFALL